MKYTPCSNERDKRVIRAMAEWLRPYDWRWFCTMHFRYRVSVYSAKKCASNFIKNISDSTNYYLAVERSKYGEQMHIHILLGYIEGFDASDIRKEWVKRYGYARILSYDKKRGAVYYVAKYITSPIADFDIELPKEA